MARSNSLPERLRYLQSFRKKFALHPDELNEATAEGPLFALFSKRIKSLPETEAQKLLEEDSEALEAWLALPENENDCLQFVRGFLMVSPSDLTKWIREGLEKEQPPLVEIDLPDEVKMKRIANRNEAAIILRWKGLIITLQAMPEELARKLTKLTWQEYPKSTVTSLPVRFGDVHGTKFVRMTDLVNLLGTNSKEVGYLLEAPGGHIKIGATPLGKKINHETWDESILENLFHTLRVVRARAEGTTGN
jgi:hypothetical protein